MQSVLDEFFIRADDGHYNARIEREIQEASGYSADQAERDRKSGEARRIKANLLKGIQNQDEQALNERSTSVEPPNPNPSPSPKRTSTTLSGKPDLKPLAIEVLNFLNSKTGRNYQPVKANIEMIEARMKEGATVEDMRSVVAKKCREWSTDEKMSIYLRPATLFNRTKYAQYQGELIQG